MDVDNQPPLRFKLSLEAAERIRERIKNRQIPLLEKGSGGALSSCWDDIADEAVSNLEKDGLPTKGCSGGKNVQNWLSRKVGKQLFVFQALCKAVDEDWFDSFDRSPFEELLKEERQRARQSFVDSFLSLFSLSSVAKEYTITQYKEIIDTVLVDRKVAQDDVEEWVEVFLKEFAVNGRQIRFQLNSPPKSYSLISVRIEGLNQLGHSTVWKTDKIKHPAISVITTGWWWKGNVKIAFQYRLGTGEVISGCCESYITAQGYVEALVSFDYDSGECYVD